MESLARYIKSARVARHWSQERLGRQAGFSRSFIAHLENGTRSTDSIATLTALAHALGVAPCDLIVGVGLLPACEGHQATPPEVTALSDMIAALPDGEHRNTVVAMVSAMAATLAQTYGVSVAARAGGSSDGGARL